MFVATVEAGAGQSIALSPTRRKSYAGITTATAGHDYILCRFARVDAHCLVRYSLRIPLRPHVCIVRWMMLALIYVPLRASRYSNCLVEDAEFIAATVFCFSFLFCVTAALGHSSGIQPVQQHAGPARERAEIATVGGRAPRTEPPRPRPRPRGERRRRRGERG